MFSFDWFLDFRKSFCGIEGAFWNPCFISEFGKWYFDKFDFKFSKFFNFSALFSLFSINQANGKKLNHIDFYFAILNIIHPFYNGNGTACKVSFVSNAS